jgi:hypothetical protein
LESPSLFNAEYWLSWIAFAKYGALFLLAIGATIEFGSEWISRPFEATAKHERELQSAGLERDLAKANAAAAAANERTAELQKETAITEERLLTERRSTARDRWHMETIVNAVMPRQVVIAPSLVTALNGLGPINVAIVDKQEPRFFWGQIVQLFRQSGIMGRIIWLPDENDHHDTTGFFGVSMYLASERGQKVASILWQQERIGGRTVGVTPIGWEAIPKNEDTLII